VGFSDAEAVMWVDGVLAPAGQALIPALDHAITVGDGAFEAAKVVHGQVFARRRHLDRLERSLAALGLPGLDRSLTVRAVEEVLAANADRLAPHSHAIVRLTCTGGIGPLGSGRADQPKLRLLVAVTCHEPPPAAVSAITVPWRRNEQGALSGVKSTSYAENAVSLARARAAGADEAIFANTAGQLCEGTRSNVFIARQGRLWTPRLEDGALAGVTRGLLLEWTEAQPRTIPWDELFEADEVFIASTGSDVTAVTRLDGRPVGDGRPGPLTLDAARAFAAGQARDLDP
jgi:branched-chain amino acid aminotransferase